MKKARKILFNLCAALLLESMSVGATLAYLTSTDTVQNTFTTGKVEITLDEAVVVPDGNENYVEVPPTDGIAPQRTDSNEYTMYPGGRYKKDPTIHVTADSEDCYVAAVVELHTVDALNGLLPAGEGEYANFIGFSKLVKGGIFDEEFTSTEIVDGALVVKNANWKLVQFKAESSEGQYTRKFHIFKLGVVKDDATEKDFKLFDHIEIPENWNSTEVAKLNGMTMDITAYGVQEAGMADCEDAMDKAGYITK